MTIVKPNMVRVPFKIDGYKELSFEAYSSNESVIYVDVLESHKVIAEIFIQDNSFITIRTSFRLGINGLEWTHSNEKKWIEIFKYCLDNVGFEKPEMTIRNYINNLEELAQQHGDDACIKPVIAVELDDGN